MAIIMVVGLHVLTAVALVMIKKPAPVIEPPKVTPPIEIQLLTPPVEINEPEVKAVVPVKKEAVKEVKPNPQPAPKSEPVPKPIVKEPIKSITPVEKKATPNTPSPSKVIATKPIVSQKQPQQETIAAPSVDSITADEHRRILAAQVQLVAQREAETQAQADRMAEDARIKAEKQAADKQAQADAAREAAARVKAQAEAAAKAAAAAAAANNTVVNFTASNAHWASKPNFSFPNRAKRGTRSGDTFNVVLVLRVNKQGGIDSVSLAQSSGNAILDREAQRQVRSGKFRPFANDAGAPVIGNVTLPVSYAVP